MIEGKASDRPQPRCVFYGGVGKASIAPGREVSAALFSGAGGQSLRGDDSLTALESRARDFLTLLRKLKPILGKEEFRKAWEQLQVADRKTVKLLEFSLRKKLADATGAGQDNGDILLEPISELKASGAIQLGRMSIGSILAASPGDQPPIWPFPDEFL